MPTEAETSKSRYHVPNLERALTIMETLTKKGQGMGISELCEELGFSKNSVYRITQTLYARGYLLRDEDNKRFSLSRKLLSLGYAAITEKNILEQSLDVMRDIRNEINLSVIIGSLVDHQGVVLGEATGGFPFKLSIDPGTRFELYCSAPGKIFMAHASRKELHTLLDNQSFVRHTPRTITSRQTMMLELQNVRKNGYAIDDSEQFASVKCVSAPIYDSNNSVVAALWITGAIEQVSKDTLPGLIEQVMNGADKISRRLGHKIINE